MILIIAILAIVAFALAYTQLTVPPTNETQGPKTNVTNVTKILDIVATQTGPAQARQGENVTIKYSIANKGTEAVYNVQIHSQDFENNVGTINPGEVKTFEHKTYIPTDKEVQQDFGPNATVSNPFFIGGFGVTFTDAKGAKHTLNSNSIEIKLV